MHCAEPSTGEERRDKADLCEPLADEDPAGDDGELDVLKRPVQRGTAVLSALPAEGPG